MVLEALEVLQQLEATEGRQRNARTELLQRHKENTVLRKMLSLCYDWKTSFYISAPDDLPSLSVGKDPEKNWMVFLELTDELRARAATGSMARQKLKEFLLDCSSLETKWYSRIINRDLRCGVATGVLGKIYPELQCHFGVALAERYLHGETQVSFPIAVEPKIDGVRIAIVIKDGQPVAYSRNFREYPILHSIGSEFAEFVKNGVIDGEIFSNDWSTTISALNSKLKSLSPSDFSKISMKLRFYAFDTCGLQIFEPKAYTDAEPFQDRRLKLETIIKKIIEKTPTTRIRLTPQHIVKNTEEVEELYHKYVGEGFEGIMLKKNTGYYNWRTDSLLKWKCEETEDCAIAGCEEGQGVNGHAIERGATETEIMNLFGWRTSEMCRRYDRRRNSIRTSAAHRIAY